MKKLFFFKSSSSNGTTSNNTVPKPTADKQSHQEKTSRNRMRNHRNDQTEHNFNSPKGNSPISAGPAFGRSRSLSSGAFLVDGILETSSNAPSRSPSSSRQDRQRNHSSRCLTPERLYRGRQLELDYNHIHEGKFPHDSSGSSSSCASNVSSKVVDRYIDGEEHLERSKQKTNSTHSNISGNSKGRRKLPPRVQCVVPTSLSSDCVKGKSHSFRETKGTHIPFSSCDLVENGFTNGSPRALARSVVERLSQNHNSNVSNHEPVTIQDIYSGSQRKPFDSNSDVSAIKHVPIVGHGESVNEDPKDDDRLHGRSKPEEDIDIELWRRYKDAEKRVKLLSEEMERQKSLSNCEFKVSSLVEAIRSLEEERVGLAYEILSLLRAQMVERDSAKEESRMAKTELNSSIQKVEREKNELQIGLEKELDRRSNEWSLKVEKYQMEEKRLRDRVRELAEQNVSLQREVSTFQDKETERMDMITYLDGKVKELAAKSEELHEENSYLKQNLSKLQESYKGTTEDLDCLKRNFEDKDKECRDLHKSVTRFLRTCREQEKTIEGLKYGLSEQIKKEPSEKLIKKFQMEQIRLAEVELSLRKEVESRKLEADSLRRENIHLLNRLKGNGELSSFKLDNEMKMQVGYLQDQGLSMLKESTQMCSKLLRFIKGLSEQDMQWINNGLAEQFIVESDMKVQGIKRGTETLRRNLQTVLSLLHEKSNTVASRPESEFNDRSSEETLRAELRAETLVTSLLREKLYSKEQELEQLQGELAAAVRGNEILRCEVQSTIDNLSINTHELKDLKLQMMKKDENISQLEIKIEETNKDLMGMKVILPKVRDERDEIWSELKQSSERNMLLNKENEMLKGKIEALDEDILLKEGQITILKDTLGSKQFDLLSSPDFVKDFLVQ